MKYLNLKPFRLPYTGKMLHYGTSDYPYSLENYSVCGITGGNCHKARERRIFFKLAPLYFENSCRRLCCRFLRYVAGSAAQFPAHLPTSAYIHIYIYIYRAIVRYTTTYINAYNKFTF